LIEQELAPTGSPRRDGSAAAVDAQTGLRA
jgi:hypothetical protein